MDENGICQMEFESFILEGLGLGLSVLQIHFRKMKMAG